MPDENHLPDPDRVYRNYLETCRRLGVEPVPRHRAMSPIEEWTDSIARRRSVPDDEAD